MKITELPSLASPPPLTSVLPIDDSVGAGPTSKVTVQQLKSSIGTGPQGPAGATGATGATGPAGSIAPGFDSVDGFAIDTFEEYSLGTITSLNKGSGWASAAGVADGGSAIVARTALDGREYKALAILNGQMGRKFGWGANWNRIQIFCAITLGNSVTFQGDGYIGICSGTTNMVASGTTDNFLGLRWENTTPNNFNYNAGTKSAYYNLVTTPRFSTRRGVTTTDHTSGAGGTTRTIAATQGYLTYYFLEISRPLFATAATSVSYSQGFMFDVTNNVEFSKSKSTLFNLALGEVAGTVGNQTSLAAAIGATPTTHVYNFDESTGVFDAINISWPFAHTFEIAALIVRKVS